MVVPATAGQVAKPNAASSEDLQVDLMATIHRTV
jgi:hypothetical protein